MKIGHASKLCGLSARMIRYYERKHVLPAPSRRPSGYRQYTQQDIERLCFIRNARTLGFSLREIAELIQLQDQGAGSGPKVLELVERRLRAISRQARLLESAKESLQALSLLGSQAPPGGPVRLADVIARAGRMPPSAGTDPGPGDASHRDADLLAR